MKWPIIVGLLALVAGATEAEPRQPLTTPTVSTTTSGIKATPAPPLEPTPTPRPPTTTSIAPECSALTQVQSGRSEVVVQVALFCGVGVIPVDLHLVSRVVPDDGAPLTAALSQLLLGVTPDEDRAGLGSAFSSDTAGQIRSVSIEDGVATIDLTDGFVRTNNFSTSNLGAVVGRQIETTVFQFLNIDGIDFRVNGERWCGWEATCEGAPVPPVTRASICAAAGTADPIPPPEIPAAAALAVTCPLN